ncbi:MAG: class I SAM-dependent methyltransferase [Chitinophagaceae bacterium]
MNNWKGERQDVQEYNSVTAEHLHRYAIACEIVKGKRVLDIASGEGYGSNIMAAFAASVVGVDISEEAVNYAKTKYGGKANLSYLQGSLQKIPLPDGCIDVVVSLESIEHDTEHEIIMKEIKRVLAPNGILIMSTPDKYQYTDLPKYNNPFHVKELYQDEFKQLINRYFKNSRFFSQRFYAGSFIAPLDAESGKVEMFTGDYNAVNSYEPAKEPLFIVAIASDNVVDYSASSFFNLTTRIQETSQREIDKVLHSASYKLGNFFVRKLSFLKK